MGRSGERRHGGHALFGLALGLLMLALLAGVALAVPGHFDRSFSSDGRRLLAFPNGPRDDAAHAVAIDRRGRIVVAGFGSTNPPNEDFAVARFHPDGSLDRTFSGDGKLRFEFPSSNGDDSIQGMAIDRHGRIVVAGTSQQGPSGPFVFAVARLLPNGTLDHNFSGNGKRTLAFPNDSGIAQANGVALDHNGRIVVGGTSQGAGETYFSVARLTSAGNLDHNFSTDGRRRFLFPGGSQATASGLAIDGKNRIVMAGEEANLATGFDFALARVNRGGGLDHTFSGDGRRTIAFDNGTNEDHGAGVALDRKGRIVVVGTSDQALTTGDDFALARVGPAGALDHSFSGNGKLTIDYIGDPDQGSAVAIDAAGRIVMAGTTQHDATGTGLDFAVARVGSAGVLDASFGDSGVKVFRFGHNTNLPDRAFGVAIDARNRPVVVGDSDQGAEASAMAIARLRSH